MDLRQFTDLGNDIGRRVTDAVNTGNYSQLNRDIKRKIEQAFMGNVYDGGLDGKLYRGPQPAESGDRRQQASNAGFDRVDPYQGQARTAHERPAPAGVQPNVPVKIPGKAGSLIMAIIGYAAAAAFGIAWILFLAVALIADASEVGGAPKIFTLTVAMLFLPFAAGGTILGIAGTRRFMMTGRIKQYIAVLKDRTHCTVAELAAKTRRTAKYIVKDLRLMIKKGYFPEGHLDDQATTFIGNHQVYQQYLQAKESAAKARAQAEAEAQGFRAMPEDLQQVIREGEAYISTIREANDAIPDEVISDKLYRMENIVRKIFAYVRENPDQVGQLRRFMNYYMPTTEKLVKAYQQMDEETVLGENMTRAKHEIAETLDTINEAYEKLYDSMYVDVAMDVSSDISVLKTMFAQEGLTRDELKGGN